VRKVNNIYLVLVRVVHLNSELGANLGPLSHTNLFVASKKRTLMKISLKSHPCVVGSHSELSELPESVAHRFSPALLSQKHRLNSLVSSRGSF
jgi:hypothetical protein